LKVMFDIGHPAHVHMFKNSINLFEKRGHEVKVLLRDKDNAKRLLDSLGIEYLLLSGHARYLSNKAMTLGKNLLTARKLAKTWGADIFIGESSYLSYISKIMGKISINVWLNERATLENTLFIPSTDIILTSTSFEDKLPESKVVRFPGNSALAYLHPSYFSQDSQIKEKLGLNKNDSYSVIRLVAWKAAHDFKESGIPQSKLPTLISELERYGHIYISAEEKISRNLSKYVLPLPPETMHHVLAGAKFHIGEGATMVMEAADLGVPSIYISSIRRGYLHELEKYGLAHSFTTFEKAFPFIQDILKENADLVKKHNRLLQESLDMNKLLVDIAENGAKDILGNRDWWKDPKKRNKFEFVKGAK